MTKVLKEQNKLVSKLVMALREFGGNLFKNRKTFNTCTHVPKIKNGYDSSRDV